MIVQTHQLARISVKKIDLRKLDEKEFIKIFSYLQKQTNDFKKFSRELLLENNQYLFTLRICLGLTHDDLARELNVSKGWVRHTEAGRNVIMHEKIADRYVKKLEALMKRKEITLEKTLENLKRYYLFAKDQNLPEVDTKFKPLMEMSDGEFKEYFELISKETENFTKFHPSLLVRIPQSILVFRIALGIDHRKFATLLGIDSRRLRSYEHLKVRIKPQTAVKFVEKIDQLFRKTEVQFQDALQNLYRFKNVFQKRSLHSCIEQGLRLAGKLPPNELENKVGDMLEKAEIPFEIHARIEGLKRDYNVDFAIPSGQTPKVIIEVTEPTLLRGKKKNYRQHVCLLDHKFQMIKARHPSLLTILVLLPNGIPTDMQRMEEMIQAETLNTDMYVIKEGGLEELIIKIKEKCFKNKISF